MPAARSQTVTSAGKPTADFWPVASSLPDLDTAMHAITCALAHGQIKQVDQEQAPLHETQQVKQVR